MAHPLPLKKSFAALFGFMVLFTTVGPRGLSLTIPTVKAATFTVSNLDDAGAGSLRQAITDANASPGEDLISFSVAGSITLLSDLPIISDSVTVDATTTVQAGPNIVLNATGRTQGLGVSGGTSTQIKGIGVSGGDNCIGVYGGSGIEIGEATAEGGIEVDGCTNGIHLGNGSDITIINTSVGTNTANTGNGINMSNPTDVVVGGTSESERVVVSGNDQNGIYMVNADNVTIRGSYIGLHEDGVTDQGNDQMGIYVDTGCTGIVIGEGTLSTRNIISGNGQDGIKVDSDGTIIQGNYIGLNAAASAVVQNGGSGILLSSNINTVGGSTNGEGNVISGNNESGVSIEASGSTLMGNCIGTDGNCDEDAAFINMDDAILIESTASDNIIGADGDNEANTLHQRMPGNFAVHVLNTAGDDNRFSKNNYLDLSAGEAFTEVAAPANSNIEDPVLTSVIQDSSSTVTLTGTTGSGFRVDVYADGLWVDTGTATGDGAFDLTVDSTSDRFTVIATNTTGGSSGTPAIVTASPDVTAPAAPTASPSQSTALPGSIVSISGTGEEGAKVYSNGADTEAAVDEFGNFEFDVTVLAGNNSFEITLVDGMENVSEAVTVSILGRSSGGAATSGGASNGGNSSSNEDAEEPEESEEPETGNIVDPDSQIIIDTDGAPDNSSSMAGDEEVVEETEENPASNPAEENPMNSETPSAQTESSKPVKNFIEEFYYEVVEPVKIKNIRDSLPQDPLIEAAFTAEFDPLNYLEWELANRGLTLDQVNQDNDGDGLTNGEEIQYGSNPLVTDTDEDGEDDIHEIFVKGTDPAHYDSDHDGLADTLDAEPQNFNTFENRVSEEEISAHVTEEGISTPLGMTDSDEDGLADLFELYLSTDPLQKDSDDDGLSDGDEWTQYGTDPNKATSAFQVGGLRIVNALNNEVMVEGQQFYMGQGPAETQITFFEMLSGGTLVPLGETETDEAGRFNLLTQEKLSPGKHTLIALAGTQERPLDFSNPFHVEVVKYTGKPDYISLNLQNGSNLTERRPTLDLRATDNYMIVVSWRSTIYSQVLIADSADQTVYAKPMENLEWGEHTVSWYAVDPSDNQKSEATQLSFTVTNAAFLNGTNGAQMGLIVLGSIAVLAILSTLGLSLRKPKKRN
ncbi:hypothetical protein IPG41_01420 [Candidatus Peregrinibacteria bacterium]|nr:MAG: hypothetical protein IPG41_01420 [Candidatus Peregrinibacteria bacterium]